tara:strand:+ start:14357 stop:23305 length:8949 start_codon:yes stop_codon:yes gene_type:complete
MNITYYLNGEAYTFETQEEGDAWLLKNPGASATDLSTARQDNTVNQSNIIIPEIQENAPLNSSDFYSLQKQNEQEQKQKEEKEKPVVTPVKPRLLTEEEEIQFGYDGENYDPKAVDTMYGSAEAERIDQPEYKNDKEILEAWLNGEYFDGGIADEITRGNIVAYSVNDIDYSDLQKHFKDNVGKLGISREAYLNLTDSDLDKIFTEVVDQQVRLSKKNESVKDEYTKINDILLKKEKDETDADAIAEGVEKLDNATINSNPDKLEALYAQKMKQYRAGGADYLKLDLDPNIEGSTADKLFNKAEMVYNRESQQMMPTGKRVPKDIKYKMLHDPVSGRNIKVGTDRTPPTSDGSTTIDYTDSYQTYLASFKNTSQADLKKYNERVLLEEAGYNIESEEVGDYYVGNTTLRNDLRNKGYKSDGDGVFKDVPLGELTKLSYVPGVSSFWSPEAFMSKGDIIPQDYKDKPYTNKEEFVDFLVARRRQNTDLISKKSALWDAWYLNRDIETISKNRLGQMGGSFMYSTFGEDITIEQSSSEFKIPIPITNQKKLDVIASQIVPESNMDISKQQDAYFERTFADESFEMTGGLSAMLLTLSPVNKVQKVLGINKLLAGLAAPRYIKNGKSITQVTAIKQSAKAGQSLDDWALATGHTVKQATSLQKGTGIVLGGIFEDIKMREVLGAVNENMKFERGVGFGFFVAPKFLPFGFGRFGKGKPFGYSFKRNEVNTFMQSTFVNAPAFALAVEGGDALGAIVKDLQGKQEVSTWVDKHWGDYDVNLRRIGLNLMTGKGLGMMHFNHLDYKTTAGIGRFNNRATELIGEQMDVIQKKADSAEFTNDKTTKGRVKKGLKGKKVNIKDPNTRYQKWIEQNPNSKEVQKLEKHFEDFNMSLERLNQINNTAEWVDPARAQESYDKHYEPLKQMFKSKGKELKIIVTDKPIYQDIMLANGKMDKQEVSALYTRMGKGKVGTIQINTKKSKGKDVINHEGLHAYVDMMFDGNPSFKVKFEASFKAAMKSIKTPDSNLYEDILKTKDIQKELKLEEMMAYSAEYLSKAEYYTDMVSSEAFIKIKKFWNNFAESTFNKKADLFTKQDVIDILGSYGKTGDFKKLERLQEMIEYDPTGKAGQEQLGLASKENINKTIQKIKGQKTEVQQEIKDLRTAQGKTSKFQDKIDKKYELFAELNANQKKLENKIELKEVQETGWEKQIDKDYTGTYKTKAEFQASSENSRVQKNIMESSGLKNMIKQGQRSLDITDKVQGEFMENVLFEIIKRFNKNYDPGKINKKFGRALTPFEYLTTGQQSQSSIVYRAIGDVAIKMGKQVKTVAADAYEGGYGAFENVVSESGYSKLDSHTGSPVEARGIIVADVLGINPITVKRAAGDAKNLNFETDAGAKEKASYKNIGKNSKIIEKDIVVDHYGVSEVVYSKMKNNASEQLNKADFEAIQAKIKPTIETHIKLIPKWGQVSVDPITGESISMKTVSGVKSETKATGITTVLLKNKLLFKEIPQTGTKGSKYEWTAELKEYHTSIDPVFKKQFEQKVLDSWGMGETKFNRAQLSGIYKAIMTQTRKAVYLQSVKQAIPTTPSLTAKHILANMLNQVSAGQSPSLAKTEINDLIKLIQKQKVTLEDISKLSSNIPGVKILEEIIMERDALTKDTKIVELNERLQAELESKTTAELEVSALESVNNSKKVAKKYKLSEKHADPNYIAKNSSEKIKGVELSEWRKSLDRQVIEQLGIDLNDFTSLVTRSNQKNHHALESLIVELGFGSKSRKQTLSNGEVVYLNKEGKTTAAAIEAFLGKKFTTTEGKSAGKYEKVYRPDWSTLKKKLDKLEKEMQGESIETIKDAKIELYRKEASYSGKSKDFEATEQANREFFEDYLIAMAKVAYKNKSNYGVEYFLQSRAMQTNHAKGISKSLGYKMASLNAIGSKPGEIKTTSSKGEVKTKDNKGISNHWEHALQLINQTNRFVDLIRKHKSITPAFKEGLKKILDVSNQHLIPKNGQLFNDAKGPTTFTKSYIENLKKGSDNPLLNVFANKYARLDNNFIVSGPNKGKSLLDVQLESIDMRIAKKIVSTVPKSKWNLIEYMLNAKVKNGKNVEKQNKSVIEKAVGSKIAKQVASKDINQTIKNIDKALENGRKRNKKARGASVFDFDETVAFSENFIYATKGKETKKIASDRWPFVGEKLVNEGWKMDFTDFNKVTKGRPGPLMQKMKNQIKKFGSENVFILTARAKESQAAIHEYLKSEGIEIPIENITGLGNSTGEAKALWMLGKFAEGYNDMYFVDDAISNVKAVKDVLGQLDIKSKVQITLAQTNLNATTNKIMEHSLSIGSEKVFSKAEAKVRGKDIKRRRIFMRDSAADLELLIEPLYGKGKKGNENKKWFKENFIMPFERGTRDYNTARQSAKNDYMALRKQNKDVVKIISKEVEGTSFTNDMAMRVYLWNKAGYKIPDLAKTTETKLVEHVLSDPKLQAYAEQFAKITKQEKGLKEPGQNWWGETMAGEVTNIDRGVSRKQYLQEFIDVKNEIFNEANLNKMESKLGTRWRENIEDMFDRMETGRTRSLKLDRGSTAMMNYLNGGIGTIMNFNTRSAALQTISTLNFLNMKENNPISAGRAIANVPQFAKDFLYIMNSDMLKQRRDGLAINVTEAEIASAAASSENIIQGVISKVLKVGYTPTKLADSFAISFGGATFYRNRIKMYEKQGMEIKAAEKQAFLDFQVLAERTQQSSRADLLSRQQTSLIGRIILPFANTPMQMNRAGMKDILDVAKGRTRGVRNVSEAMGRITYYMGAQVAMFAGLQSALFGMLFNDEDVSEDKIASTKAYTLQSTMDSMLRGFGVQGALISTFKNATLEFLKQNAKPAFKADYSEVAEDLLNLSPPIGSKYGMLDAAGDRLKYNRDTPLKLELGNGKLEAALMTIQATTNAPVYAPYQNINNMKHALSDQYETWQRVLMGAGWTPYNVGIELEKKKKTPRRKKFQGTTLK